MASQPERVVLTYEDLTAIPPDRNRYELFYGELNVTAAPNTAHQDAVLNLATLFQVHVRAKRLGRVYIAPYDVILSDTTIVEPDIMFVSTRRRSIVTMAHIRGAPDLVVEVLSPSTQQVDRHVKMQLYAQFGVSHYWIVDPERREILGYALEKDNYRLVGSGQNEEEISLPPYSDLRLKLSDVWESNWP